VAREERVMAEKSVAIRANAAIVRMMALCRSSAVVHINSNHFMKTTTWTALTIGCVLAVAVSALAQDQRNPSEQLEELVAMVQAKIRAGERTEAALAAEIKEFDALLEQHKATKTDEVAHILFMKAMLYTEVFKDTDKGIALLEQLQREFPETERGNTAARMIAAVQKQSELAVGKTFPDFDEKDLEGNPLSISRFKGKVVLIDFWAVWCGPCIAELPHVLEAYAKHHDKGFEIIGISLDQDRAKLDAFLQEKGMTWPQYFDGQGWQNKLAQEYGINSIPATFLLDGEGKIIAKDLRGDALDQAVARALAKN
jgi:thiol-disulfide isomerase/thioredoxin